QTVVAGCWWKRVDGGDPSEVSAQVHVVQVSHLSILEVSTGNGHAGDGSSTSRNLICSSDGKSAIAVDDNDTSIRIRCTHAIQRNCMSLSQESWCCGEDFNRTGSGG